MTFFPQPNDVNMRSLYKQMIEGQSGLAEMVSMLDERGRRLFGIDPYPDDWLPSEDELAKGVDMDSIYSNQQNGVAR
jgi:hypothetical protein